MFLTQMLKKTLWGGCGKCLWVRGGWMGRNDRVGRMEGSGEEWLEREVELTEY